MTKRRLADLDPREAHEELMKIAEAGAKAIEAEAKRRAEDGNVVVRVIFLAAPNRRVDGLTAVVFHNVKDPALLLSSAAMIAAAVIKHVTAANPLVPPCAALNMLESMIAHYLAAQEEGGEDGGCRSV